MTGGKLMIGQTAEGNYSWTSVVWEWSGVFTQPEKPNVSSKYHSEDVGVRISVLPRWKCSEFEPRTLNAHLTATLHFLIGVELVDEFSCVFLHGGTHLHYFIYHTDESERLLCNHQMATLVSPYVFGSRRPHESTIVQCTPLNCTSRLGKKGL